MSLSYKILWIDDQKEVYESNHKKLEDYIKSLFFIPTIHFFETIGEANISLQNQKYDVIFSDYNINEEKGNDFIKSARKNNVHTEILFYSGQTQLPSDNLDRVTFFFSSHSRFWYENLLNKMKELISFTVEKLQDMTTLRGFVMSEVCELDNKMNDIIMYYFVAQHSDDKLKLFQEKIVKSFEKSIKDQLNKTNCNEKNCKHKWYEKEIKDIVSKRDFDSSKKAKTIELICKTLNNKNEFYEKNYVDEILKVRNELAHCKSIYQNGEEVLKTKDNENKVFKKQDLDNIRKNIQKYHKIFDDLYAIVSGKMDGENDNL